MNEVQPFPVPTFEVDPEWRDMDNYMEVYFVREEDRVHIATGFSKNNMATFFKQVDEFDQSKGYLAYNTIHGHGNKGTGSNPELGYSGVLQRFFTLLTGKEGDYYNFRNDFSIIEINSGKEGISVNVDGVVHVLKTETYFPSAYLLSLLRDLNPMSRNAATDGIQNLKFAAYNLDITKTESGKIRMSRDTFLYK